MDKLLVYGGTFNPIHNAHLRLAAAFARALQAQVLLIPTRVPPHKQARDLACGHDRLAMCRLAAAPLGWQVSDRELRRPGPSYTADTLEALHAELPHTQLYFLTGEDMFCSLFRWRDPARILRTATVCGAPRSSSGLPRMRAYAKRIEEAGGRAFLLDVPYLPVSSTQVRQAARQGRSIAALVPATVARYISEHALYQGEMKNGCGQI